MIIQLSPFFLMQSFRNFPVNVLFFFQIKFSEDTSNFDLPPGGDHSTLNLGKHATLNNGTLRLGPGEHAFFEFTFRRFFDEDGRAQAPVGTSMYVW